MKRAGIILLLSMLLFSIEAEAYSFTDDFNKGFYWGSFPFGFAKFVVDASDGPLLEQLVRDAEEEWENAVGRDIWNVNPGYSSGAPSGNHIRWSFNFGAETGYDPTQTLAITVRHYSGTNINKTEIILNGELAYLRANSGGVLWQTILHEMGHTIGLDHSNQQAIMAPTLGNIYSLQADDQNGANDVINIALWRQATGYVSPFSAQEGEETNTLLGACGTVDMSGGSGPGGGFYISFLFGLLLVLASKFGFLRFNR